MVIFIYMKTIGGMSMFIKFLALVLSALMAITSIPVTSEMPEKNNRCPDYCG